MSRKFDHFLKILFFLFFARPLVFLILGLQVQNRDRLPRDGPTILVANHNSHLDTLVLMSLFPLSQLPHIRPVADEQYFLNKNRCLAWMARHIFEIIPVTRTVMDTGTVADTEPRQALSLQRAFLKTCGSALSQNTILILYPEGSRGEPEQSSEFKSGIAHLAKLHPNVPIVPVYLQGLGKVLPKGDPLLVPFLCRAAIGEPLYWSGSKQVFLAQLSDRIYSLAQP